jgi:molybdate transport system ATP-binding protein/molybdate/tungstate transport system ATP-binding protein
VIDVNSVKLKASEEIKSSQFTVAIRPEEITLHFSKIEDASLNVLEGTVSEFVDQGHTVLVDVKAKLPFQTLMTKRFFVEKNLEIGQKVWFTFKSTSVKVIK